MTTISLVSENTNAAKTIWRARAGSKESFGRTAGEALDALAPELDPETASTLVMLQRFCPDRFFTAEQQQRLLELMARWRVARDTGRSLPPDQQAELEALVAAQLEASAQRAEALLSERAL